MASTQDFKRRIRGSSAQLIPWLQDWNYAPQQVQAQIDAARDVIEVLLQRHQPRPQRRQPLVQALRQRAHVRRQHRRLRLARRAAAA